MATRIETQPSIYSDDLRPDHRQAVDEIPPPETPFTEPRKTSLMSNFAYRGVTSPVGAASAHTRRELSMQRGSITELKRGIYLPRS